MIKPTTFLSLFLSLTSLNAALKIDGEKILHNDKEIKLLGLRCSNALISDKTTDDLISHLDLYQEHGLNTVSVFLMGSRFGDIKGYLPDSSLNPVYAERFERILRATAERKLVTIVGCLYWSTSTAKEDLSHWKQEDANKAVANTATWLKEKGFADVILDPDNEGMASRGMKWKVAPMIDAARKAHPSLLIANNTKQNPPNEDLNMHFGKYEKGKPWLDSEATPYNAPKGYWGDYSKKTTKKNKDYYNYSRIGRYTEEMKKHQLDRTQKETTEFSGHILASTWLQCGPTQGINGPFAKPGGQSKLGSVKDENAAWNTDIDALHPDAGILWWLEYVKETFGSK